MGKAILFSAPSGCGKTTIINELMKYFDCFDFSISATSRAPRGTEQDGKDYYFLTHEEFKRRVDAGDFLEWEEVYQGTCYGTLKSEIERIWAAGRVMRCSTPLKVRSVWRITGAGMPAAMAIAVAASAFFRLCSPGM